MNYTIDANVFVSDAVATDMHHDTSQAFLDAVHLRSERAYCPTIILAEAVSAIARPTRNVTLALREIGIIRRFPGMTLVGLTIVRSCRAAQLAAVHRLRGADSIYAAVAEEFGTTLITWDVEMRTRASGIVTTMTPAEWLAASPSL